MPGEPFVFPKDAAYTTEIRKISNTDPVNADTVVNPLLQQILTNIHALKLGKAELDADGKVPAEQLPVQGGLVAQAEPPDNTRLGWIDTGSGGVLRYYDAKAGAWKPAQAVWG